MITSRPMGTPQDRARALFTEGKAQRFLHLFLDLSAQNVRHPEENVLAFPLISGTVRESLKGRAGGKGDRRYRIVTAYFKDPQGDVWSVVGKGDLTQWPARCYRPVDQARTKQKVRALIRDSHALSAAAA